MRYYKNGNIQKFPMECKKQNDNTEPFLMCWEWHLSSRGNTFGKTLKHVLVLTDLGKSICSLVDGYTVT